MGDLTSWKGLKLETPANYRIRVQGHVPQEWFDRLGGMSVTQGLSTGAHKTSTLQGYMPDQAALSGVLNTLYELHLPLLNVECIDEPKDSG
jgi:hypothetical protein